MAGILLNRLAQASQGLVEMSPAQVQAARAYLERTRPALQAVEYSESEALPEEGDIVSKIQALTASDPALKARLAALLLGSPQPIKD